jgi:D,D-heptose 1,7-bisphosphate phosphatase
MKAVILCAGKGERLKPLTDTIPKPMITINNKPILEYLILLCKKHGFEEIFINTSYLPEKIKEYFGNGEKWGIKITYSYEPELLGTSGALNNFKEFLNDTFIVIYGDNITDIDLTRMLKFHKKNDALATLALRKKSKEHKAASFVTVDNKSQLTGIIEKPSDSQFSELCKEFYLSNSGIYILEPNILDYIPEGFSDFAYDIFPKTIKKGEKLVGFMMDEYYFREVGKKEKYELAKNELESGKNKLSYLGRNKAVFIDRDGVINENIYEVDGQIMSPATLEQLKVLPKVKEGIQKLKKYGFKIIAITNQPGVAFGLVNHDKLNQINNFLKKELEIDEIYSCPHHPSKGKVKEFVKECQCRKPKIGMLLQAARDFDIDFQSSYILGDSLSDIETGNNASVKKTFLVGIIREDILNLQYQKQIFPDFTLPNLVEIAEKIIELENNKD